MTKRVMHPWLPSTEAAGGSTRERRSARRPTGSGSTAARVNAGPRSYVFTREMNTPKRRTPGNPPVTLVDSE